MGINDILRYIYEDDGWYRSNKFRCQNENSHEADYKILVSNIKDSKLLLPMNYTPDLCSSSFIIPHKVLFYSCSDFKSATTAVTHGFISAKYNHGLHKIYVERKPYYIAKGIILDSDMSPLMYSLDILDCIPINRDSFKYNTRLAGAVVKIDSKIFREDNSMNKLIRSFIPKLADLDRREVSMYLPLTIEIGDLSGLLIYPKLPKTVNVSDDINNFIVNNF